MNGLTLYNSLTRKKEAFLPADGTTVKLYACGPTVYSKQHIGNFRSFLAEDVLHRVLQANGFHVRHVMNVTDVGHLTSDADSGDDKMEEAAKETGRSAFDIAKDITELFFADAKKLNILPPDVSPKATDHIKEQIGLIQTLEQKSVTYRTNDGIYFDTAKFPGYGKLSTLDSGQQEGARVEKNPEKRNASDFALWKFSPKNETRQMEWESPWGIGFPGWHIECSAMAMKYLGETLDIHCGGIDHLSLHHPNEIAQSETATGNPFSRFWFHVEFLNLKEKMSKSLGNVITLDDILAKGFDALAFRYLCLTTHYRKSIAFSWEALEASQNALNALRANIVFWKTGNEVSAKYLGRFKEAMNDDLNTSQALAVVWDLLKSGEAPEVKRATLNTFDAVLGLKLKDVKPISVPHEIDKLLQKRESAKVQEDYELADALREQIKKAGYTIRDTPTGPAVEENTTP